MFKLEWLLCCPNCVMVFLNVVYSLNNQTTFNDERYEHQLVAFNGFAIRSSNFKWCTHMCVSVRVNVFFKSNSRLRAIVVCCIRMTPGPIAMLPLLLKYTIGWCVFPNIKHWNEYSIFEPNKLNDSNGDGAFVWVNENYL